MLTYDGNNTVGVYTLTDFLSTLNNPAAREANQPALDSFRATNQPEWMGLEGEKKDGETDIAATLRLLTDGYRKGVDLMREVEREITVPTPRSVRRVQRWMAQGDDVEMQRVWNGNLDAAWRGSSRDTRHGPQRVRLLVDSIAPGVDDAKLMRWRGVAALKLADALTEAGYSVQVEGVISCQDSSNDSKRFVLRTIVKDYTAPVDLLTLAATTVLPAYFRSLMHTWGLVVAKHTRWGPSYQVPKVTPDDFGDEHDDAPSYMLARTIKNAQTASDAVARIVEELDKAGE